MHDWHVEGRFFLLQKIVDCLDDTARMNWDLLPRVPALIQGSNLNGRQGRIRTW
jgi:hypothetical protein